MEGVVTQRNPHVQGELKIGSNKHDFYHMGVCCYGSTHCYHPFSLMEGVMAISYRERAKIGYNSPGEVIKQVRPPIVTLGTTKQEYHTLMGRIHNNLWCYAFMHPSFSTTLL